MADDLRARVLALLAEHHVMTLATHGRDGPWAAAVFYAAQGLRLYFLSSPRSRHAQQMAESPQVAATIQHDYDDWPAIRGLQIAGRATPVPEPEAAAVRALYERRYPLIGAGAGLPQAILRALDRIRWYVLEPTDIHLIDNRLGFGHREHLRCGDGAG
ncbi:MAG: pyridoxamine 5'-phosphate oxidase family protein [Burkholderiales bacterium]|nr:pyridoxamine 5'-phosphate oxidase family protein [Burkholderiales bacterium]